MSITLALALSSPQLVYKQHKVGQLQQPQFSLVSLCCFSHKIEMKCIFILLVLLFIFFTSGLEGHKYYRVVYRIRQPNGEVSHNQESILPLEEGNVLKLVVPFQGTQAPINLQDVTDNPPTVVRMIESTPTSTTPATSTSTLAPTSTSASPTSIEGEEDYVRRSSLDNLNEVLPTTAAPTTLLGFRLPTLPTLPSLPSLPSLPNLPKLPTLPTLPFMSQSTSNKAL